MHTSRKGQVPEWFEAEGFAPAINPDFEAVRFLITATEVPGPHSTAAVTYEWQGDAPITVRLDLDNSGQVVGVAFGASAGGSSRSPVSGRAVRRIPLGELEKSARESVRWELATRVHSDHPVVMASVGDDGMALRESLSSNARPGRRGRDDLAYASLAAEYVKRLRSDRAVADLAEAEGYSVSRVRNMLHEARRRGLLTRPPAGKSGGQLTPKASALLSKQEEEQ